MINWGKDRKYIRQEVKKVFLGNLSMFEAAVNRGDIESAYDSLEYLDDLEVLCSSLNLGECQLNKQGLGLCLLDIDLSLY